MYDNAVGVEEIIDGEKEKERMESITNFLLWFFKGGQESCFQSVQDQIKFGVDYHFQNNKPTSIITRWVADTLSTQYIILFSFVPSSNRNTFYKLRVYKQTNTCLLDLVQVGKKLNYLFFEYIVPDTYWRKDGELYPLVDTIFASQSFHDALTSMIVFSGPGSSVYRMVQHAKILYMSEPKERGVAEIMRNAADERLDCIIDFFMLAYKADPVLSTGMKNISQSIEQHFKNKGLLSIVMKSLSPLQRYCVTIFSFTPCKKMGQTFYYFCIPEYKKERTVILDPETWLSYYGFFAEETLTIPYFKWFVPITDLLYGPDTSEPLIDMILSSETFEEALMQIYLHSSPESWANHNLRKVCILYTSSVSDILIP